jgi:hypothetical protein
MGRGTGGPLPPQRTRFEPTQGMSSPPTKMWEHFCEKVLSALNDEFQMRRGPVLYRGHGWHAQHGPHCRR